jgi:uncharacterized delta-60 repeat protein
MAIHFSFRSLRLRPQALPSFTKRSRPCRPIVEALEDRLLPSGPGTLDPTFGSGGAVLGTFTSPAEAVQIQSDGKLLVAGYNVAVKGKTVTNSAVLARYNVGVTGQPDGSLDSTFGSGGKVVTLIGSSDIAYTLAIYPATDPVNGGKLLMAGTARVAVGHSSSEDAVLLARYNPNGNLDSTFGSGGTVTTLIGSQPGSPTEGTAVLIQGDGKILVAGTHRIGYGGTWVEVLVRYNPTGSLDSTFGSGGNVITALNPGNGNESPVGLALETIGSQTLIVVAGRVQSTFALARYNLNGTLDTTFGQGGMVTTVTPYGAEAAVVTVQGDAKILLGGTESTATNSQFAVARYNTDGSLDTTFNATGLQPGIATLGSGQGESANAMVLQPWNGKIIVAGSGNGNTTLARFNADGTVDTSFGINGEVVTALSVGSSTANGMVLQSDGKIVTAGYAGPYGPLGTWPPSAVLRYIGDTLPAPTLRGSPTTVSSDSGPAFATPHVSPDNLLALVLLHSAPFVADGGSQRWEETPRAEPDVPGPALEAEVLSEAPRPEQAHSLSTVTADRFFTDRVSGDLADVLAADALLGPAA